MERDESEIKNRKLLTFDVEKMSKKQFNQIAKNKKEKIYEDRFIEMIKIACYWKQINEEALKYVINKIYEDGFTDWCNEWWDTK